MKNLKLIRYLLLSMALLCLTILLTTKAPAEDQTKNITIIIFLVCPLVLGLIILLLCFIVEKIINPYLKTWAE
jgi:hypothetical protein